jgi:adhesin/invasin
VPIAVPTPSTTSVSAPLSFLKITYTCCNNSNSEVGVSDTAYNLTSVADQKFAKVRRQNLIVKQKEMDLTVIGF